MAGDRLGRLSTLLATDKHAPTTVRDPLRIVEDHLADSLVALELDPVLEADSVVDLGSGAGVPGLPLAIALPEASFALLESSGRKASFIERAADVCALTNVEVVNARAEAWREGMGRFDLAMVRALAALDVVLEYAAPLLVVGGYLVAWRGRRDPEDEAAAGRAAAILGFESAAVRHVHPFPEARNRYLHLLLKVRETPARFPRRPGIALKRPLGRT